MGVFFLPHPLCWKTDSPLTEVIDHPVLIVFTDVIVLVFPPVDNVGPHRFSQ